MGTENLSLSRRAALIGATCSATACASRHENAFAPKRVLFVCQYGTVKSAIAREHFRRLAASRAVHIHAESRGISPEDHIAPALSAALDADGLNIRGEPIRALTAEDLPRADIIVVFDPLPTEFGSWPVRDWTDLPSMNANYSGARAILLERINSLLNELVRT